MHGTVWSENDSLMLSCAVRVHVASLETISLVNETDDESGEKRFTYHYTLL